MLYDFVKFHENVVTVSRKAINMEMDEATFSTRGFYMTFVVVKFVNTIEN
jgi:hypothetical protein